MHGRFVDGDLRPIAGVLLAVVDGPDADVAPALAAPLGRTGPDGTFLVAVPVPKDGALWLVAGGGRLATMSRRIPAGAAPVDLGTIALAPGFSGIGRVRDAGGAPLAGARVVATDLLDTRSFLPDRRSSGQATYRTAATTNAAGVFRLPGMVQSVGQLRVQKDGYYDEVLQSVAMGEPLDVQLSPSPVLRGKVVDGTGRPLARARVRAGEAVATCGDDGTFAVALRDRGVKNATAWFTAGAQTWSGRATFADPALALQLTVAVSEPADAKSVRVTARTASGLPLADFRAYVSWNPENQLQYRPDALLLAGCAQASSPWWAASLGGTATMTGERNGEVAMVFVHAPGHAWTRVQATGDILGGEALAVTLLPEAVLAGQVTDENGVPVAGAEVIPTQRLTDSERTFYTSGFRDPASLAGSPANARTDGNGRYELRGVPPGDLDLFVYAPGRIAVAPLRLQVPAGERRGGVDLQVPANVTLRGKLSGPLPTGAQVRVHWHRPNMSSSAWASEFGGGVDVAADGTFTIPDLHPKAYEVQLVVATPPRGGGRMKVSLDLWQGTAPAQVAAFAAPTMTSVSGHVAGPVPWSRLAVGAVLPRKERSFTTQFTVRAPYGLVQPDRTFRLMVPGDAMHLVLFDPVSGIPLEWREITGAAAAANVELSGRAEPVVLNLVDAAPARRAPCSLEYEPLLEFWPAGVGDMIVRGTVPPKCQSDARLGDAVTLWLPSRAGTLRVASGGETTTIDATTTGAEPLDVVVPAKADGSR